jgi:hypothetical protein
VSCSVSDAAGDRILVEQIGEVRFRHQVRSYKYHDRPYQSSKLDVTFVRTRAALLPALPVTVNGDVYPPAAPALVVVDSASDTQ